MDLGQVVGELEERRSELQTELHRLEAAIHALRGLGPGKGAHIRRRSSRFSAATRRKMAVAQKARWAKFRKDKRRA